jgi:pyruvate dehydrogenase E1 component alpha subunit
MAALWDIPVIFVIENNGYSMGTSVKRCSAVTELYSRGESLGVKGTRVDGMDLAAVYNTVKEVSEKVRATSKPHIIEMETYRYKGHSVSDPGKYRMSDEIEQYKTIDPMKSVREEILSKKIATEEDLNNIESRVKQIVKESVEFGENSPVPDDSELMTDILR